LHFGDLKEKKRGDINENKGEDKTKESKSQDRKREKPL
jgi:hypothetical protein